MAEWWVLKEQTANDMGWIHPIKRVRDIQRVNVPGNIKKASTAYKWITTPMPDQTHTCRTLWQLNKNRRADDRFQDQYGYIGHWGWSDEKCARYHEAHVIAGVPRHALFPGWRISAVTQDPAEVRSFMAAR